MTLRLRSKKPVAAPSTEENELQDCTDVELLQQALEPGPIADSLSQYCESRFCSEVLQFWQKVREFKKLDVDDPSRVSFARAVINEHITVGAKAQINLDDALSQNFLRRAQSAGLLSSSSSPATVDVPLDLFDVLQDFVYAELVTSVTPSFRRSTHFQTLLASLSAAKKLAASAPASGSTPSPKSARANDAHESVFRKALSSSFFKRRDKVDTPARPAENSSGAASPTSSAAAAAAPKPHDRMLMAIRDRHTQERRAILCQALPDGTFMPGLPPSWHKSDGVERKQISMSGVTTEGKSFRFSMNFGSSSTQEGPVLSSSSYPILTSPSPSSSSSSSPSSSPSSSASPSTSAPSSSPSPLMSSSPSSSSPPKIFTSKSTGALLTGRHRAGSPQPPPPPPLPPPVSETVIVGRPDSPTKENSTDSSSSSSSNNNNNNEDEDEEQNEAPDIVAYSLANEELANEEEDRSQSNPAAAPPGLQVSASPSTEHVVEDPTDWNARYQRIILQLGNLSDATSSSYRRSMSDMHHLNQDFINTAQTYGRIIITERGFAKKTIAPVQLGGLCGGQKYIVHNIVFKFALDIAGLFMCDDHAAAKVANHELNGLMAYQTCRIPTLCTPFMALIDYLGYRLIAISLLPLDGERTLVYGTANAGKEVRSGGDHPTFAGIMAAAAQRLNLAPHLVGAQRALLHSAADVEGHVGSDGRLYLLDFSRALPPTAPDTTLPGSHLYQMFRPEFLARCAEPLCPDAFSGFLVDDAERAEHNRRVREATATLIGAWIPSRVRMEISGKLQNIVENTADVDQRSLPGLLHGNGINLRLIGHLLPCVASDDARIVLLIEVVARICKNELRRLLRVEAARHRAPVLQPYLGVVVAFANRMLRRTGELGSEGLWETVVQPQATARFAVDFATLSLYGKAFASPGGQPLRSMLDMHVGQQRATVRSLLLTRFSALAGITWDGAASGGGGGGGGGGTFDESDLSSLSVQVKHSSIVDNATGCYLLCAATAGIQARKSPAYVLNKIAQAEMAFRRGLASTPNNRDLLVNLARAQIMTLEASEDNVFTMADDRTKSIEAVLHQAETCREDPDPLVLYMYAVLLEKAGDIPGADDYFIRSLQADSQSSRALRAYGDFLHTKLGLDELAVHFLNRARLCIWQRKHRRTSPLPVC